MGDQLETKSLKINRGLRVSQLRWMNEADKNIIQNHWVIDLNIKYSDNCAKKKKKSDH